MELPENNIIYKKKEYWDERFEQEDAYDWLVTFDQVKSGLVEHIKPSDRILMLGCGNSTLSADLYNAGYKNIVNMDYSPVVIDRMRTKYADMSEMTWDVMDMKELTYEDKSFDVVLDKGSLDALMVDEGDVWDPEESVVFDIDKVLRGVTRVLVPGGKYLMISFAQPHFRTKYLMAERIQQLPINHYSPSSGFCSFYDWDVSYSLLDIKTGCMEFYLYVAKKRINS